MAEIDAIISAVEQFSLIRQLRDKVSIAFDAQRDRCGSCYFWMKSRECPRERNVGGMSRGPSCEDRPCTKFQLTDSAAAIRVSRIAEAVEFATQHDLPVPQPFREALKAEDGR